MSGASPASTRTPIEPSNSLPPMYCTSMPVASSKATTDCSNLTVSASAKGPSTVTTVPAYSPAIAASSAPPAIIGKAMSPVSAGATSSSATGSASSGAASSVGASTAASVGVASCVPPPQATRTSISASSRLNNVNRPNLDIVFFSSQKSVFKRTECVSLGFAMMK